jgi:hypothetical protein
MSDTDLKALKRQFSDRFNAAEITDTSEAFDVAWKFIEDQFQIAVPLAIYENATTNFVRLQNKVRALPSQHELLILLETVLWDRGDDDRVWPEDEAVAFRNVGPDQARHVMFLKASAAVSQRIDVSL